MIRRATQLLLILSLFFGGSIPSPVSSAAERAAGPGRDSETARVSLVQADDTGVVLLISAPEYQIEEITDEGQKYHTLRLPGAHTTVRSGAPQVPALNTSLGVPPDAHISVQILQAESQVLPSSYRLRPAPVPISPEDEFLPGKLAYIPDPQAYANQESYPSHIAEISSESWLRDQRIVSVAVYPFQYRPASGRLTWHKQILLRVDFAGDATTAQESPFEESPFEALLQNTLLNYEQARQWRAVPAAQADPVAGQGIRALATRYKIVVEHDGLYRLAYNDIVQAGIPTNAPANWRLSNLGDTVTMRVTGQADGSFDPGDELLFYGERFRGQRFAARYPDDSLYWLTDNCAYTYCPPQIANYVPDAGLHAEKYTRENVYWLTIENTPQPRWSTLNGTPNGAPVASYFTDTVRAEQNNLSWTYHFTEENTWFWESASAGLGITTTRNYATTLLDVAGVPFTATVRGDVVARTSNAATNPDHRASFSLNNNPLAGAQNITWDGPNRMGFEGKLSQSQLLQGTNQLNFAFHGLSGSEQIYFNWFELEYARLFRAANNELWFNGGAPGNSGFRLSNFSNNQLWALDITYPLTPTQITDLAISGTSPYTASFEVNQPAGARYYLTTAGNLKTPKSITTSTPSDLLASANGADYIFITHRNFITPTQELADYRASQGLRTKVVDIQDVYDLFSDGIFNPGAIKNFLGYAYTHWQSPAPRYVMLVGDGHWNFFGYAPGTYTARPIYLPPYLVLADPWQGEVDSSNLLATVAGNDSLPDLLIGRAVVASQAEMQAIVDKIKAYEAGPAAGWKTNLSFVADNTPDPAGDFVAENEEIIASHVPAGYTITRLYQNDFGCTNNSTTRTQCDALRKAIITDTLNISGTLIMSYVGHGSPVRWSGEEILNLSHVPSLSNATRLPIMLDMTCLTGYYISALPNRFSLAAELVRAANKGSIAAFAPTGLGVGTGHSLLHGGFFDAIFQDEVQTLGEAALASKLNLYANHYYFDLLNTFTVFGDPALRLPIPLHQADISSPSAAQDALPGQTVNYSLAVRNAGNVTDSFTLSAQDNAWPAQLSITTTGPLSPGEAVTFNVAVQVPAGTIHGDRDTVTVTARSQANPSKTDQQGLTTSVKIQAGVEILPTSVARNGLPGETVAYTLRITNTGELADVFSAQTTGDWNVTLDPSAPLGPLAPGATLTLTASIAIPPATTNGSFSTSSILLRSRNNPAATGLANLLTSVYIPSDILVFPANEARDGLPGQTVNYTIQITNTGSLSDRFDMQLNGPWPASLAPGSPLGPLAPGASQAITLSVSIPLSATNGSFATSSLTLRSQNNAGVTVTTHYLTNVTIRSGVSISPAQAAKAGEAGNDTLYELEITNTGNVTDTFTIEASAAWPLTLTPAASIGPIPPGGKGTLQVVVHVPVSASPGAGDTARITVHSQNAPAIFARATLQTQIGNRAVYLPLVIR